MSSDTSSDLPSVSYLISQLLNGRRLVSVSPAQVLLALGLDVSVAADDRLQADLSHDGLLDENVGEGKFDEEVYATFVKSSRLVARELHVSPGEQALIVNGRVSVSLSGLGVYA